LTSSTLEIYDSEDKVGWYVDIMHFKGVMYVSMDKIGWESLVHVGHFLRETQKRTVQIV
jgi:hypothetical protein